MPETCILSDVQQPHSDEGVMRQVWTSLENAFFSSFGNTIPSTFYRISLSCSLLLSRFTQGTNAKAPYAFYHWQYIDIFNYFTHNMVTVPPAVWTNAAHKHGVVVLGEWTGQINTKPMSSKGILNVFYVFIIVYHILKSKFWSSSSLQCRFLRDFHHRVDRRSQSVRGLPERGGVVPGGGW